MDTAKIKKNFLLKSYNINFGVRKQRTIQDTNYVAYINSLRGMDGLIESLRDSLSGKAVIEELWLRRKKQVNKPTETMGTLEAYDKKPSLAKICTHVVLVTSEDDKILEYSKFLINRYMNMYSSIVPADEMSPQVVEEGKAPRKVAEKPQQVNEKIEEKVEEISAPIEEKITKTPSFMQKVGENLLKNFVNWLS